MVWSQCIAACNSGGGSRGVDICYVRMWRSIDRETSLILSPYIFPDFRQGHQIDNSWLYSQERGLLASRARQRLVTLRAVRGSLSAKR